MPLCFIYFLCVMRCSAEKLDKKDTFGKSDPYFNITRKEEGLLERYWIIRDEKE